MPLFKKTGWALLIIFIIIQFIRPTPNRSNMQSSADITTVAVIPDTILDVMKNACYDCHSNDTHYPWYVNIQPVGWFMARHIKEGKENLNFSEFAAYPKRRQANKLRMIATSVREGTMPLSYYTLVHKDAKLSKQTRKLISDWALRTEENLANK